MKPDNDKQYSPIIFNARKPRFAELLSTPDLEQAILDLQARPMLPQEEQAAEIMLPEFQAELSRRTAGEPAK